MTTASTKTRPPTGLAELPPDYDDSLAVRAHWGLPGRQMAARVSLGVWEALTAAAEHYGVRVSAIVRAALTDWLVAHGFIRRMGGSG